MFMNPAVGLGGKIPAKQGCFITGNLRPEWCEDVFVFPCSLQLHWSSNCHASHFQFHSASAFFLFWSRCYSFSILLYFSVDGRAELLFMLLVTLLHLLFSPTRNLHVTHIQITRIKYIRNVQSCIHTLHKLYLIFPFDSQGAYSLTREEMDDGCLLCHNRRSDLSYTHTHH